MEWKFKIDFMVQRCEDDGLVISMLWLAIFTDFKHFWTRFHGFIANESYKTDFSIEILSIITHRLKLYNNEQPSSVGSWIRNNMEAVKNELANVCICQKKYKTMETMICMSCTVCQINGHWCEKYISFECTFFVLPLFFLSFFIHSMMPAHVRDLPVRHLISEKNRIYSWKIL